MSVTENLNDVARLSHGNVLYWGRPEWLTDDVLRRLRLEAHTCRAAAHRVESQWHAACGPVAAGFTASPAMRALLQQHVGPVRPSGTANYLYYEEAGAGIEPHTDSPAFPLQVLLMLAHEGYGSARSELVVFPEGPASGLSIRLEPGEFVLFKAANIIHGRTRMADGESACLLGAGFMA